MLPKGANCRLRFLLLKKQFFLEIDGENLFLVVEHGFGCRESSLKPTLDHKRISKVYISRVPYQLPQNL